MLRPQRVRVLKQKEKAVDRPRDIFRRSLVLAHRAEESTMG